MLRKKLPKKVCFIPGCSTTENDGKIMLTVPDAGDPRRSQWLSVVNVEGGKRRLYCCEDHFELKEDSQNWVMYSSFMDTKLRLKPNVVPHMSLYTPRRRRPSSQLTDSAKKRRKDNTGAFKSLDKDSAFQKTGEEKSLPLPEHEGNPLQSACGTSQPFPGRKAGRRKQLLLPRSDENFESDIASSSSTVQPVNEAEQLLSSPNTQCTPPHTSADHLAPSEETPMGSPLALPLSPSPMTEMPNLAENSQTQPDVQADVSTRHRDLTLSPVPRLIPNRLLHLQRVSPPLSVSSSGSYKPSISSSSDEDFERNRFKSVCMPFQQHLLKTRCRFYLGLTRAHFILINTCSESARMSQRDVMIVLKKIRTGDEHARLADDFGISVPVISGAFSVGLLKLSALLKHFIFWPSTEYIMLKLPLQFRYEFSQVQSIIDGFEIEIEKPQNPIHQSLTWSDYKSCNTVKYLISCTPQGFINFVSEGYGGRTSDQCIVEKSTYIQELPNSCTVLADRGFKQIERMLAPKNCKLVRPPSVKTGERLSPDLVKLSKRISAVRIHVERVIGRVREFKFCSPHARVDHNHIHLLDHAVVVACALVNLQDPLIR